VGGGAGVGRRGWGVVVRGTTDRREHRQAIASHFNLPESK
jgi:hypothetical protein